MDKENADDVTSRDGSGGSSDDGVKGWVEQRGYAAAPSRQHRPIDVVVKQMPTTSARRRSRSRKKMNDSSSSDDDTTDDEDFQEAVEHPGRLTYVSRHQRAYDLPDLHLLHDFLPPDVGPRGKRTIPPMSAAEEFADLGQGGKMPAELVGGGGEEEEEEFIFCFPTTFEAAREQANIFARKVWLASWKVTHFYSLPEWLQDNDYLHSGHRPPLPSFSACFKSIFRIHTETGNIWTHMVGCVLFIGMALNFMFWPESVVPLLDKLVFLPFFVGAVACLGLSFAFHTVHCHSESVGKLFSKLDYVGIAMLITGSFIPWLYYGFYCKFGTRVGYMTAICCLGIACIVVSLWDKFSEPEYRPWRAGVFMGLGLSALIPCAHHVIAEGIWASFYEASLGWMILMAVLYLTGALLYAFRVPERFFPGKCDLMFQSHQIFHSLVVLAAFVHYHGVTSMAGTRLSSGSCQDIEKEFFSEHTWEL